MPAQGRVVRAWVHGLCMAAAPFCGGGVVLGPASKPCPPAPNPARPQPCPPARSYVVGDSRFQRYCKSNPRKMVKVRGSAVQGSRGCACTCAGMRGPDARR